MSDKSRPQILSVDDEVNILRALKRTLRKCDADVTTCESPIEALELIKANKYNLIISDMRMPEMQGAELLAQAAKLQPDCKRVLLTGYADLESTIKAINEGGVSSYLSKPWDDERLITVVNDALKVANLERANSSLEALTQQQNEQLRELNNNLEETVEKRTAELANTSDMLQQAVNDITDSYRTMVTLLSDVVGLRDKVGSDANPDRLALSLAIADHLEMDEETKLTLEQAVLLHRIGRATTMPDALLAKPYVALQADERKIFDQHPVHAEAVLMAVPQLNDAAKLIRHQHERWDGKGFPDALLREAAPMGARILAIVRDYFDLMAGLYDRVRLSDSDARDFIEQHAGSRYDPELVTAFLQVVVNFSSGNGTSDAVPLQSIHLRPGMELARDLKTASGVMLLPKGSSLNETVIGKIVNLFSDADTSPAIYVTRASVFEDVA